MRQWVIYKHISLRSGKSYIGLTRNEEFEHKGLIYSYNLIKGEI